MFPIVRAHYSPGGLGVFGVLAGLLLGGCLISPKDKKISADVDPDGGASARIVLRTAALVNSAASAEAAAAVDSIAIRVTGEGMDPKEFGFAGSNLSLSLAGIPPGPNRAVTASLFRQNRLLYLGTALATFSKETRAEINLRCEPQFSRVVARFHLPPSLPLKVAGGTLVLTGPGGEFRANLELRGEFGSFLVDEVPGGVRYDVALALTDAAGKVIYESSQAGLLLPLGEETHWDLNLVPTEAIAGLVLELPRPREALVGATFPSRLRRVGAAGEVVVSELYPAPSPEDSGSEGEWWEIFNRTADSLSLSGCRLTRTRGGGATMSYAFDSAARILPGRAMTFGRARAGADVQYADFSLVNTTSPLLLLCSGDSLLVDSLRYSSTVSDSLAATIREGSVTSVNPDSLHNRTVKASWCLTQSRTTASPGSVGTCPG